jgi:hypothetical protein
MQPRYSFSQPLPHGTVSCRWLIIIVRGNDTLVVTAAHPADAWHASISLTQPCTHWSAASPPASSLIATGTRLPLAVDIMVRMTAVTTTSVGDTAIQEKNAIPIDRGVISSM